MAKRIELDYDTLLDLYYIHELSANDIAERLKVSKRTVLRNMKMYNMTPRDGGPGWNKGKDKYTSKFVKKQASKMVGNRNGLTNGLGVAKRLSPKICKEVGKCFVCESVDDLILHHEDRNHANNSNDNLTVLCRNCHGKEHAKEDGYGAKFWNWQILEDEIVDIKLVGVEMTYDLTMEKWSNFVANKFIVHNCGRHAGAVIITAKPVTEILPVMRAPGDDETFSLQAQWDKKQLETIGINKYDILGLSTLTSLRKCEEITGKKRSDIPDDDPKTWEYLRKAKNMEGIFQLSSPQMRGWCRKVIPEWKPGSEGLIDFLSDINAINRPAVLASGLGELYVRNLNSGKYDLQFDYDYIRIVLDLSNGVILYQEQVIYLAKEIAGMSFGKGDLLRRNLENMGTAGKRSEKVAKENEIYKKEFIEGAKQLHGYSDEICLGLWNWLCDSSGYGFCRAHSFSYSILGYQTAYFKANYPIEFYCVSINEALEKNSAKDNPVEKIVKEAQNNGIKLNLPSNGNSSSYCILNSGSITYGLNMIKGVSEKAAQLITQDKYNSFEQFCGMVLGTRSLNKKHVKTLIQIGYFSEFGTEAELWYKYQKLVWEFENLKKKMDWQGKKDAGRKVREFSDLKFEAEPLEGNKKQWLLELIGFNWENKLSEVVKDLEDKYFDTDKYIIGEVTNTKTGVSSYGTAWCLVFLKTEDGEKTAFLKDASYRLHKGDVIISKYLTKEGKNGKESTTLYDIIRY